MSPRNKITLSLISLSVLALCLIVFLVYPLFSEIKKTSLDLLYQRKTLLSLEAKVKELEHFKTLSQEIEPNLEKISNLFIAPEAPVEFIDFLEKTALGCQVSIEISSAFPLELKEDPWPSLSFQINTISPFPNFLKFLEKLENSPYLIEIKSLNITRLGEKELQSKEAEGYSLGDTRTNLSLKVFSK